MYYGLCINFNIANIELFLLTLSPDLIMFFSKNMSSFKDRESKLLMRPTFLCKVALSRSSEHRPPARRDTWRGIEGTINWTALFCCPDSETGNDKWADGSDGVECG